MRSMTNAIYVCSILSTWYWYCQHSNHGYESTWHLLTLCARCGDMVFRCCGVVVVLWCWCFVTGGCRVISKKCPHKSVFPEEYHECLTRVCYESVLQECLTRVFCSGSVPQESLTRVSDKMFVQGGSCKIVTLECLRRAFPKEYQTKSVSQECAKRVCKKSVPQESVIQGVSYQRDSTRVC